MPDRHSHQPGAERLLRDLTAVSALMTDSLGAAARLQIDASLISGIAKAHSVFGQRARIAVLPSVELLQLAAKTAASFSREMSGFKVRLFDGTEIQQAMKRLYELGEASLPPNWRSLSKDEQLELFDWMLDLGWCLAWAPRSEIISELLSADNAHETLLNGKEEVIEDLFLVLEEVDEPVLERHKQGAREALESFVEGRMIAAQATSSSLLTHVLYDIMEMDKLKDARVKLSDFDPHEVSFQNYRTATVLATIGNRTLEMYHPGDGVPTHFNRHASTHTLSEAQYNEVNALVSLLNLISLLRELQEQDTTS